VLGHHLSLDFLGHLLETRQIKETKVVDTLIFILRQFSVHKGNGTACGNMAWALEQGSGVKIDYD